MPDRSTRKFSLICPLTIGAPQGARVGYPVLPGASGGLGVSMALP